MSTDPTLLQLVQEIHTDVREIRTAHGNLETRVGKVENSVSRIYGVLKLAGWAIPILLPLLWSAGCFSK